AGIQARAIGHGFAESIQRGGVTVWACAILPEHTHLVIARHPCKVEQIVNLMKGEATKALRKENLHTCADQEEPDGSVQMWWARKLWKVFLDSDEAIRRAIRYVKANPDKEDKPRQRWSFVQPYNGV